MSISSGREKKKKDEVRKRRERWISGRHKEEAMELKAVREKIIEDLLRLCYEGEVFDPRGRRKRQEEDKLEREDDEDCYNKKEAKR